MTTPKRKRPAFERTQIVVQPPKHAQRQPKDECGTLTMLSDPAPGSIYLLDQEKFVVGRAPEVDLSIDDLGLSRAHARIIRSGNNYFVEDLKSTNGTCVNGERIGGPTLLSAGSRIQLGRGVVLRFAIQDRLEHEAARRVYEQSVKDALTGVYNRRYLEERLAQEFSFAQRHHSELTVMMFDVDYFKRVNDTFGHQAGDAMLQALGQLLQRHAFADDVVARYGGEEFILLCRGIPATEAKQRAEGVRLELERADQIFDGRVYRATMSVGVACLRHGDYESESALLAAADQALYRAKDSGRNRVVMSHGEG